MKTTKSSGEQGFTLIELMIVTTIFGVLAGVAVPNLMSSRLVANEAAVIATMRAISTAQFQVQSSGAIDVNRDSVYEYGTLGELGGIDLVRGRSQPILRNLLSKNSAAVDATGRARHHGYQFCLYLPDAAGTGIVGMAANAGSIDADMANRYWTCVAWPQSVGSSGRRTFFINQQGQVLQNKDGVYSGDAAVPAAGAALVGVPDTMINSPALAVDTFGADGRRWSPVQ